MSYNKTYLSEREEALNTDISVLSALGYTFKSDYKYYTCEQHNSLKFAKGNNNFWVYTWYSQGDEGNIIDFVIRHANMNYKEAIAFLLQKNEHVPQKHAHFNIKKTNDNLIIDKNFELPQMYEGKKSRMFAYLCKTRYIDYNIIAKLTQDKLIDQDEKGNVAFIWKNEKNEVVGCDLKGTLTYKSYAGIVADSDNRYGFNVRLGNPKEIILFEAAIDLLSYYTLHKNLYNVILVSMSGLKMECLDNYKRLYPDAKFVLAIDNDDAANNFIDKNELNNLKREVPDLKDWNEDLMNKEKLGASYN